ncbi:hypothetical protein BGZ76_002577 [Entomortierella beljakovae]|nr:hypothetical protein BGZ76_002577 [Entomortierella beljakovae]
MAAQRKSDTTLYRTESEVRSASSPLANAGVHRSINVQKVSNLHAQVGGFSNTNSNNGRNLALAQLWSQCASDVSYTSSVATAAIIDLVSKDALDWNDALESFENALATAQGLALANMLHSLSSLFIAAAEASCADPKKSKSSIKRNVFGVKNNRHPFISLIITKVNQEATLFAEMDRIVDQQLDSAQYRCAAFKLLSPFLDFCILDRDARTSIASSTAMLWIVKVLNSSLFDPSMEPFAVCLFDYLCTVPNRFPLDRSQLSPTLQTTMSTLVNFYSLPSTQHSLPTEYKQTLGSQILLMALSWISDMRRFGVTTLPLMNTVQTLFRERKGFTTPSLPYNIFWPALSYLLLNSPTVDEQRITIEWMYTFITTTQDPIDAATANLAILPIFQVIGESQSEAVNKKCSEIVRRLEALPRSDLVRGSTVDSKLTTVGVMAMIHAEISNLYRVWNAQDETQGVRLTLGDNSALSSLIYTTFMFHPNESLRIDAITQQAQVHDGRLVTLVLFIYLLRVDPSPYVKLHLLQEAIPSLVTSNDEVVTGRILRTILTLINGIPNAPSGSKFLNSHMGAVGVRILFLIWKRQPRIWKTLRHVIHGWVENRPRLFKTPVKGEPEYDMEVAILTTIRDICAHDAAGYAEVLIPFLTNLLESVELYASSVCTIIETMNLIIEANVVDPRAAWNIILCHVAEYAMKTSHPGMIQEMCVFYGIVGSRSEDTQVFLELREAILEGYIKPLLTSDDPEILSASLKALSSFTASEIFPILPDESPILYVRERILEADDTMVVDEYSLILDKLVRHELQHMRRGLFKDAVFKKAAPEAHQGTQEIERLQGVLTVVSNSITQKWQSGDVNPGLRIGYALSSQLCSSVIGKRVESENQDSAETIRVQQNYRNVMAALTDVALTDHLVERISALEGWTALFDNMWAPGDDVQTQTIAETLISDLYKKVSDGYVPAHCANAIFAITGTILSLHRNSHPLSTVQSSVLANYLLQSYVRPETFSDVGGSDEVQFAVLVSLSFIIPLAAVDEKLVTSVIEVFSERLQADAASPSTSSDLSTWAAFATGWAFCNLLTGLVDAPTKTSELNEICHQTLRQLLAVLEANSTSFALTLGILIAFPRLSVAVTSSGSMTSKTSSASEEAETVLKVIAMARNDLENFLSNQQQVYAAHALARLLGAPWVIAFSDRTATSPEDRKKDTGLLDQALLIATSRRDLQSQLVHFTVPFCHMIHTNLDVRNPPSSEISLFTGRIHSLVNLIRITPTSAARHTAVVALSSLIGVDWTQGPTVTSAGNHGLFSYLTSAENSVAMASVTNSALMTLMELCGLSISITSTPFDSNATPANSLSSIYATVVPAPKTPSAKSALMVQDLKAGRLAAVALGHIAFHFHRLGQADAGKVIGTSSEPKDYSRLPTSTSWLRALWDGLWEPLQMGTAQRAQKSYTTALELLLYTVHSLPTPLPAVNWFPLLTQLISLEPKLLVSAIHLASRHANTSTSLMEFLIMSMSNFHISTINPDTSDGISAEELLVGEEGFGRILTLGGLPLIIQDGDQATAELDKVRGLDGLARKVTLPGSRVIDLVEKLVKILFFKLDGSNNLDNSEVEVLQLMFLDTLSNHTRAYRNGRVSPSTTRSSSKSGSIPVLSDDAKELLGELRTVFLQVYYQVDFTEPLVACRVLRRLADLSLMSVSHLDAAQFDATDSTRTRENFGSRILKEAVGISSLYSAGYLTSQQESRLVKVAQSALLAVSEISPRSGDVKLAETAISVVLYSMNSGVGERRMQSLTKLQRNKKNVLRTTWLQRILDLLVLVSSHSKAFTEGLRLLLGGAVLLWWDEHDVDLTSFHVTGTKGQSTLVGTLKDDAEANLLEMADDHDLEHGESRIYDMDFNILEDGNFEIWHDEFLQSVTYNESALIDGEELSSQTELQRLVLGRMSLIMPDIVMSIQRTESSSSGDNQTASRLLKLALDSNVEDVERQFLISLLRRMEELVPKAQGWVLR